MRQFGIFLRNASLVFSNFLHDSRSLEYLKTDRALFPAKFIFARPNLGKKGPRYPKIGFFGFFEKFCRWFFLEISKIKTNIVINISPQITCLAKF